MVPTSPMSADTLVAPPVNEVDKHVHDFGGVPFTFVGVYHIGKQPLMGDASRIRY